MNARIIAGTASVLAAVSFAAPSALANEGYFSHGYGAVNKSMAGAGVAAGFDAMSQATNPASLALVETQLSIDLSVLNQRANYEAIGAPTGAIGLAEGSFDSERGLFYIPSIGSSWEIDDSSSWGWALYANGGLNTTWPDQGVCTDGTTTFGTGPFCGGKAGIDLAQAFLQFTYAQEISPGVYLGISPIIAVQRFKAEGLGTLAASSIDAARLTGNGYDLSYGYGGKLGLQMDIGAGLSFGAAYQTEMFMTDFDEYSGLLANGGEFNIPATLQTGFSWRSKSGFVAALDYKRIFYGDVDAISNPIARLDTPGGVFFGSAGGPGFGWEDVDIIKFGLEIPVGSAINLRAGAAVNTNPIPESEVVLNILTPGVQEQHYTAGLTWKIGERHAINIAGMYSPTSSVVGPNGLDLPANQQIELESSQWEATLGWSWMF